MSPIRKIQSGVYPGTPCGCTKAGLNPLQTLMVNDGASLISCNDKIIYGSVQFVSSGTPVTGISSCTGLTNVCDGISMQDLLSSVGLSGSINAVPGSDWTLELWAKTLGYPGAQIRFMHNANQWKWTLNPTGGGAEVQVTWENAGHATFTENVTFTHIGDCSYNVFTFSQTTSNYSVYSNGAHLGSSGTGGANVNTPGGPFQIDPQNAAYIAILAFAYYPTTALTAAQVSSHWAARD